MRISIYAVDEVGFGSLIDQPVSDLLRYYAANGPDSSISLYFVDCERNLYFHSSPIKRVTVYGNEKPLTQLSEHDLHTDPFLARTVRDLLQKDSSLSLEMLMNRFSSCPSIDCIKEVTSGYRRWWIGSFLDRAEKSQVFSKADYEEITFILKKLLGHLECGKNFVRRDWKLNANDFVIIPKDTEGMFVWTAVEASRLQGFIREFLAKENPHFGSPPEPIGIGPEKANEWDEWVHSMLQELLRIEDFKFEKLKFVGFIS